MASSWKELFILGCGQFLCPEDIANLAPSPADLRQGKESEEAVEFMEVLARIQSLGLDSMEFACLRSIQLFKQPSSDIGRPVGGQSEPVGGLSDPLSLFHRLTAASDMAAAGISDLQVGTLVRYTRLTRPDQADRAERLLSLLASLSLVASSSVRDLFFRATIGSDVDIHQIVIDMFKNSSM
jgi:hypothetical protein